MSLRDMVIFGFVFGSLPFILARPYIGILVWSVLAFLNPHRFGIVAYNFRFSLVVGAVLIVAVIFSRDRGKMIWTPVTYWWVLFFCWTGLTTFFALEPADALEGWSRWWKINLVCMLAIWVMQSRERLNLLVWTIVISLGFFGLKGGIYTLLGGGEGRVWGPPDSFLQENNGLGLALIMTVPLMRYLQLEAKQRWVRLGLGGAMLLTALAILGTHSRGAFLGLIAMGVLMAWKSPSRWKAIWTIAIAAPLMLVFMPASWHERIGTIGTYEQDGSAMGRINAWWFAFHLAEDRPLLGGGFNTFTQRLFPLYAPNPTDWHDAHSIYFQVLGEQGFVGFALFLLLGFAVVASTRRIAKLAADREDLKWAKNLGLMAQVSLMGYAVSGAFLGLAYFDLPWNLVLIIVVTRMLVERAVAVGAPEDASARIQDRRAVIPRREQVVARTGSARGS